MTPVITRPSARATAPAATTAAARRVGLPARVDAILSRVSMYVLVLVVLGTIAVTATVLAAWGALSTDPLAMVASAAIALAATWAGTAVGARFTGARPHPGSWAITGLILFLLLWPDLTPAALGTAAVAGLVAGLSKFVLAWRGRHVLNPAAAGAVAVGLVGLVVPDVGSALWWVGSATLLPVVAAGALLVLWRTRGFGFAAAYAVPAWALTTAGYLMLGTPLGDAAWWALSAGPIVFLAGFMLTEPLTAPPRRAQRAAVAAVVAVGSALPLLVGVPVTPSSRSWQGTSSPSCSASGAPSCSGCRPRSGAEPCSTCGSRPPRRCAPGPGSTSRSTSRRPGEMPAAGAVCSRSRRTRPRARCA
ncbi:hypothetical protein [Promicromonospora sp. NFX87]|uniref:hypothetical protein n=1 Tax=Promicromonospora sp. NFX87 TaxID=3402691 RepID=UPI003AFA3F05